MTAAGPPPPVVALAARVLSARDALCPSGHVGASGLSPAHAISWTRLKPAGPGPAVWLARAATSAVVLKAHAHPRAFSQELHAYEAWLPRLGLAATPRLLGVDLDARLLALSLAPGDRMSQETQDTPTERRTHAAAGSFARALHGLEVADPDPVPLLDAVRARLARALDTAAPLLTPAERDGLAARARAVDAFAGARRVPCHRDFTPENWMSLKTCPSGHLSGRSSGTAPVTILDFEHARLDAAEVDLVKLRADVWPTRPDLEAAFLDGYGPRTVDSAARLTALLALHAAATLAWAERHGAPEFRALGRRALAAALA